jgi:hypothetical protein
LAREPSRQGVTQKNRLLGVRKTLRDRHLRIHVVSFFEFACNGGR